MTFQLSDDFFGFFKSFESDFIWTLLRYWSACDVRIRSRVELESAGGTLIIFDDPFMTASERVGFVV